MCEARLELGYRHKHASRNGHCDGHLWEGVRNGADSNRLTVRSLRPPQGQPRALVGARPRRERGSASLLGGIPPPLATRTGSSSDRGRQTRLERMWTMTAAAVCGLNWPDDPRLGEPSPGTR